MTIRTVVTRGYGNGTFNGTIPFVVLRGYSVGAPAFVGTIPDITLDQGDSPAPYDLSTYFLGADSYSITPAVETGWTFDTGTAYLTVLTDNIGTFGPYTITATNTGGTVDSNPFSVIISEVTASTDATGGWWNLYDLEMSRRARERKRRKELEEKAKELQDDIDKELVKELNKREKEQERITELRRLSRLAEAHREDISQLLSESALKAAERAIEVGSYSAMEQFEREVAKAKEEEEFLIMCVNILMRE